MKQRAGIALGVVLGVFGLTVMIGCVQTRATATGAAADRQAVLLDNPAELVNRLSGEISEARMAQVNLLSPAWFKRAEAAFFSAQEDLAKGNAIADIRASVMEARANLVKAQEIAAISRTTLAGTLEARDLARSAGATNFEEAYQQVENDFLNLTRAIERDNLSYAQKNREKVSGRYRELEVRAIKEDTIGAVRNLIAQAEAADARKLAPLSYDQAARQLQATDAFISANPYAKEKMHAMAKEALFQANRLVAVTSLSNQVKAMQPEAITLLIEDNLHTIAAELGAQDMRDHDLKTQLDNIIGSIEALHDDRAFIAEKNTALQAEMEARAADYQTQIDALNVQVATLEGKTREDQMAKERLARERLAVEQRLAAEKKFNQQYVAVQNYFASEEAEVYKQENQLVIRLKAMRFPVGQSIIMPDTYNLLSKVQKAI